MKKILTKRKQAWVNNFKPNIIRGLALTPNAAVDSRYYATLIKFINRMCDETERELRKLFLSEVGEQYFAQDESIASQARILTNALMAKFNKMFADISKPTAEIMAEESDNASSNSVHSSMQKLSGGLSLPTSAITPDMKEILNAVVTENVGLIKSISKQYLDGVQGAVMRSITTGNGLQDLVPYLENHKGITHRRARMIARDQTKKAYSQLSRARMQNLGIKKFEWLHSGGGREPRKLHQAYSGRIFSFDNLPILDEGKPERGIPGQAINCGCKMIPVLEFGEE